MIFSKFYIKTCTTSLRFTFYFHSSNSKHSNSIEMIHTDSIPIYACLIDPGTSLSILPLTNEDRNRTNLNIYNSTNNSILPTYGTITRIIDLGSIQIPWTFVLAEVSHVILGSDFIEHYNNVMVHQTNN